MSPDGSGGIEEGDAFFLAMGDDVIKTEAFGLQIDKVILVAEEDFSLQTPVIVDVIGVKEVDAPPFALWRETAEEEDLGVFGQERDEGVVFHLVCASCDVFFVQIAHDGCSFSMQR